MKRKSILATRPISVSYDSADPTQLIDLTIARRVITSSFIAGEQLSPPSLCESATSPRSFNSDPPSPFVVGGADDKEDEDNRNHHNITSNELSTDHHTVHAVAPARRVVGNMHQSSSPKEWDGSDSYSEMLRLKKLDSYAVLDTEAEEQFERIVRLCSRMFSVPICLVSLLDQTRQWFKSRIGLSVNSTPKEISFCRYAISKKYNPSADVYVVLNALEHDNFAENPMVQGDPSIRFYAGACLRTSDGFDLGTLCIIDNKPRDQFTESDKVTLRDMAQFVIDELELRKKNVELEIAKQKAETADRLKTSFLAHMSHEIRTPLTSMLGLIDLVHSDGSLSDELKHYLRLMKDNGIFLQQILSDILDLSKIEANQLNMEKISFSPLDIVKDVSELFSSKASDKGIYLDMKFTGLDPSKPEPTKLLGDPTRFRQVLWNLVSNALKFTLKGGISIRLTELLYPDGIEHLLNTRPNIIPSASKLSASDLGRSVLLRVEVEDTGIGMKDSQVQAIFQPFVQADSSTTRQFGGTGLGLSIVEKLVRLMGGTIGVDSVLGKGSCFWFTLVLPMAPSSPILASSRKRKEEASSLSIPMAIRPRMSIASSSPVQLPAPDCTARPAVLKLLVAEDNSTIRLLLGRKLKMMGHEFTMTTNGEEAIRAFMENTFDMVLCDMFMPVMDGLQVIQEIRTSPTLSGAQRDVPIIAFTADVLNESVDKYLKHGANAVLAKPIDWNRLQELLHMFSNGNSSS